MAAAHESAIEYVSRKGWAGKRVTDTRGAQLIMDCPLCGETAKKGNRPFYINVSGGEHDGRWNSWCCHKQGNLWTLKDQLQDHPEIARPSGGSARARIRKARERQTKLRKQMPSIAWVRERHEDLLACKPAKHWLNVHRGISDEAAEKFSLGYLKNPPKKGEDGRWLRGEDGKVLREHEGFPIGRWLVIPFIEDGEVANIKMRNFDKDCDKKDKWRRKKGGKSVLFGSDLMSEEGSTNRVYICEGELDAVAAWELGLRPVVGSSLGAGNFPDEWKEKLAPFSDVFLLYDQWDDDSKKGIGAGDEGAEKAAGALGKFRCRRVVFPAHDVNDWLLTKPSKEDIEECLEESVPYDETKIVSAWEYSKRLRMFSLSSGVSSGWNEVDSFVGGIRDGEVTIVTADTSIGKSTFSSDFLRRQAEDGHAGMYWAIEGGPAPITRKWWCQLLGRDWKAVEKTQFDLMIDSMEDLPLYLFPGLVKTVDDMLSVLRYFVRRFGGRRLVVDHFHAHLRKIITRAGEERFEAERWLDFWCWVAGQLAMHIVLVAHPRNPGQNEGGENFVPTLSHFKGTSGGKQDPDNFLVLARKRSKERDSEEEQEELVPTKVIGKKVRSDDGHEGSCVLTFHKPSQRYLSEREVRSLITKKSGQSEMDWKSKAAGDDDDLGWFDDPE